MNGP